MLQIFIFYSIYTGTVQGLFETSNFTANYSENKLFSCLLNFNPTHGWL